MTIRRALFPVSIWAVASLASPFTSLARTQEETAPHPSATASSDLPAPGATELQQAIDAHDYLTAEKILLAEIERDPHSPSAARLLAQAGTVYFLNHDYLNAAIAWKKSDVIAPLAPSLRFSLAMAYIGLSRPDWARPVLESLAQQDPRNALYPYWQGRLEYDLHWYQDAIHHFQHAIELNPSMARAYDNLGLCYFNSDQNELAITSYNKAIELDRASQHPSPWPYINLAAAQQFLGQLPAAEANLHEALRLDPSLSSVHFQLASVLEDASRLQDAVIELKEAIRLDPAYADPHIVLARIYHKLGQQQAAHDEVKAYQQLHPATSKK